MTRNKEGERRNEREKELVAVYYSSAGGRDIFRIL